MNKEDLKKNYILLSKVAKEKKYAQEYLGLLARRGDLGSIRIGKRWYTTREWFSEFLQDAQERKVKAEQKNIFENILAREPLPKKEVNIVMPITNPKEGIEELEPQNVFVSIPARIPVKFQRKISLARQQINHFRPEKKSVVIDLRKLSLAARPKLDEKAVAEDHRVPFIPKKMAEEKISVPEVEISPVERFYQIKSNDGILSPAFPARERREMVWLPRFAFGFAFVLLFFLLFQGTVAYKKDVMKLVGLEKGVVAGASDEKKNDLNAIRLVADYYVSDQGNQIKESISLSQLMLRAAIEKEKNSEEDVE